MAPDNSKHEDDEDHGYEYTASNPVYVEDIYDYIIKSLFEQGYKLLPHAKGKFAGHKAYKLSDGLYYTDGKDQQHRVRGIKVAPRMYREISSKDIKAFDLAVRNIPREDVTLKEDTTPVDLNKTGKSESEGEEGGGGFWIAKTFGKLCNELVTRKKVNSTRFYELGQSKTSTASSPLKLSLTGANGAHKVAPQQSWFTPELLELDPRELLTILPDAEAEMFMLILGRIVCGARAEELHEQGELYHEFAHMAILVGGSGMGKSYTMRNLVSALKACGYDTTTFDADSKRFNISKAASSDLAFLEDLTADSQYSLLTHKNTKSLVSNGAFDVEDKGIDAIEVTARTTMIALSNTYRASDFLKIDDGMKRRLNYLKVYEQHELHKRWGTKYENATTGYVWAELAARYGVCEVTLAAYLLMRSKELFLRITGHTVEGLVVKYTESANKLQGFTEANRELYAIPTDLHHVRELVEWYIRCTAFSIVTELRYEEEREEVCAALEQHISFDPVLLAHYLYMHSRITRTVRTIFERYGLEDLELHSLDSVSKTFIKGRVIDLKTLCSRLTGDELLAHITAAMKAKAGHMGYPKHGHEYNRLLQTLAPTIREHVDKYVLSMAVHRTSKRDINNTGLDTGAIFSRLGDVLALYDQD